MKLKLKRNKKKHTRQTKKQKQQQTIKQNNYDSLPSQTSFPNDFLQLKKSYLPVSISKIC